LIFCNSSPQSAKCAKKKNMEKEEDKISNTIIGAAIEVHKNLGHDLLESTYEGCICFELALKKYLL